MKKNGKSSKEDQVPLENLKELYLEWAELANLEGGVCMFRPELVMVDFLEAMGMNTIENRTFIFGEGEPWAGLELLLSRSV